MAHYPELKARSQDMIMSAIQSAFAQLENMPRAEADDLEKEISKQMARVERLFGYEVNSWGRGA